VRKEITDRYYRVFTYQQVDRVPDVEFGYWPQTIRRWLAEGMPLELSPDEASSMFSSKVDAHFGFENEGFVVDLRLAMNPPFEEEILQRKGESVIMRDSAGIVAERYLNDSDLSSIPRFLEFPVKTRDDWEQLKPRYRLDEPFRDIPAEVVEKTRKAAAEGRSIAVGCTGFYGQLRHWLGFTNLSLAFFDDPGMIHDMVAHWAELCARQIERLPEDIPVDDVRWWEDMAGKNGPFVSPEMFRRFLQPGYHRVMEAAKERGCAIAVVDCDGNPHDIVGNWLEEGVNIMFPLEIEAGVDPAAWREEFGPPLRLRGGIAKAPLVEGGRAIDAELERVKPLLEEGGFIPHLDHLVPPDIPYSHYCQYLEKKRKLIGR